MARPEMRNMKRSRNSKCRALAPGNRFSRKLPFRTIAFCRLVFRVLNNVGMQNDNMLRHTRKQPIGINDLLNTPTPKRSE